MVGLFGIVAGGFGFIDWRDDQWYANGSGFRELYGSGDRQFPGDRNQASEHHGSAPSVDHHYCVTAERNGRDRIQSDTRRDRRNGRVRVVGYVRILAGGFECGAGRNNQRHANGSKLGYLYSSSKR